MLDAREGTIFKLASLPVQSIATAATGTIYTVPTGKSLIVDRVEFEKPSATAAAATSIALGANSANFDDWLAAFSLVNLDSSTKTATVKDTDSIATAIANSVTVALVYTAGQNFSYKVTTGAAGVTCTINLWGHLI